MSLVISEDVDGRLVVDFSEEPRLADDPALGDILIAFPIASRRATQLVLEIGDQVADALDYVIPALQRLGLHVSLSPELQDLVVRHHGELELIEKVRRGQATAFAEPTAIPGLDPSASLLPHQLRGLRKALTIENAAEFSVQGAGKTAIVLSAFSVWKSKGEIEKLLVIGPASCFRPWEEEISRWLGTRVHSIRWSGSASERTRLVPAFHDSDIVLCTYDTARRDQAMLGRLLRLFRTLLVLDESHYIKNFDIGARGATVLRLGPYATRRMVLTGTPTPHSLEDLWMQFAFLWPYGTRVLIGSRQQYLDLLVQSKSPARDLRDRLSPFFHRTTQAELDLPQAASNFTRIPEEMVPHDQTRIIRLLEMRVLAEARLQLPSLRDKAVLAQWQKARVTRLLQAASNPGLLLSRPDWSLDEVGDIDMSDLMTDVMRFQTGELVSAKISWSVEKAKELVQQRNKVVVWTWWVDNLHLLNRLLADLNPLLLYGAIKPYEEETDEAEEQSRERNIREFKTRDDRPLLIANPAACAEAISLHKQCHNAIYVDRTFNCGQFLQSLNRIHRVGLPSDVTTFYWIPFLDCAVERSVDARLQKRQQVMYEFLDDNAPILGIDVTEESHVADSSDEIDEAFQDIRREIERGKHSESAPGPG